MDNAFQSCCSMISSHKCKILIPAVIVVLIATLIIAGLITDWFGIYGPITKITLATAKTIQTQNFSADFDLDNGNTCVSGKLQLHVDSEKEYVEIYIEAKSAHATYILAIYESNLIYGTTNHLFSKDISEQLKSYFAKSKKNVAINSIDEALDMVFDLIPEQIQTEINAQYIDIAKAKKLVKSFALKKLNRTSWLKKNAGYSTYIVDGIRYYSFQSNNGTFLQEVVDHFKPAFISQKLYDQLMKRAETVDGTNTVTKTLIAVDNGYLSKFETVEENPDRSSYMTISFYDIGTTTINIAHLQNLLDNAKTK